MNHLWGIFLAVFCLSGLWACTNNPALNDFNETEFSNPFPDSESNAGLSGNANGSRTDSAGLDGSNANSVTEGGPTDSAIFLEKLENQKSLVLIPTSPTDEEIYIWGSYP